MSSMPVRQDNTDRLKTAQWLTDEFQKENRDEVKKYVETCLSYTESLNINVDFCDKPLFPESRRVVVITIKSNPRRVAHACVYSANSEDGNVEDKRIYGEAPEVEGLEREFEARVLKRKRNGDCEHFKRAFQQGYTLEINVAVEHGQTGKRGLFIHPKRPEENTTIDLARELGIYDRVFRPYLIWIKDNVGPICTYYIVGPAYWFKDTVVSLWNIRAAEETNNQAIITAGETHTQVIENRTQ